jgi:16S rRNA (cytidine1402-2'-O)-methyltransferase
LTTALAAAGFSGGRTIFMGFAPRKKAERRAAISSACQPGCIVVFFESPHRISNLLTDIYNELGDRPICVARELTKLHQEVIVGRTKQVTETDFRRQGEFTVVIGPQLEGGTPREVPGPLALSQEFYHLTNIMRIARRAAVSRLAHKYETTSREMYTMVERALDFGN